MYRSLGKSIFRMHNFFDEVSIVDAEGIIQYSEIFSPDMYGFTADEIIGKSFFDVFPSSTKENSEIWKVIQTGRPIVGYEEDCITYKGNHVHGFSSIYPMYDGDKIFGAAVALKFFDENFSSESIQVHDGYGVRSVGQSHYYLSDIITKDPGMMRIKDKILVISNLDSSVLIEGSTGTGKELVAQSIHYSGSRADKPYISQNCSAIPANLLESTLFGTEKGSYTGAVTSKGLFELADGGTLFLDEINSMDIHLQSKLLKAIEEKSIRHLGGHENIPVDIRIIAAINEEPFQAIEEGRLRSDLFYRLNVISLRLPPLCEREGDIQYVTDYFIKYFNEKQHKVIKGLSSSVAEIFRHHDWPGNVRELRNVIEGTFAFRSEGYIQEEDLPDYMLRSRGGTKDYRLSLSFSEKLETFERELLLETIHHSKNKTEAAKKLGMTKQALNYKLDKLNLK